MQDEVKKYRAQFVQIAGLSCMSPLGKLFLDIKDLSFNSLSLAMLVHITASLLLFSIGIILINRGIKILKGEI